MAYNGGLRLRLAVVLAIASGCGPPRAVFICRSDDNCVDGDRHGRCEANNYCSFFDTSCNETGRRYGDLAPPELAQACVMLGCGGPGEPCCGTTCAQPALVCDTTMTCAPCTRALALGDGHGCVVKTSGELWCWGAGANGQLGNGGFSDAPMPTAAVDAQGRTVGGVHDVALGARHSCALSDAQTISCFGDGSRGQRGDGSTSSKNATPTLIGLNTVSVVAAGEAHTCVALNNDDEVWCWGADDAGQLGDQRTTDVDTPVVTTTGGSQALTDVVQLAAGASHTCALKRDHTLWCWGANGSGQLGDGSTSPQPAPTAIDALGDQVAQVAAGSDFTCARTTDGTAWCWGDNSHGQAAQMGAAIVKTPTAVPSLTANVVDLAAGATHACAVETDGAVVCWGAGASGQLGDGDTQDRAQPVAVLDGEMQPLAGASSVAVGGARSCVRRVNGTVVCWGSRDHGGLGDGGTSGQSLLAVDVKLTCP
jgi:alpha-tubulin suppressor-like RCC1 family protein